MTDHPSEPPLEPADPSDRRPTEAEEAGVQRLLAEARHDAPMPAEVAARLDEAIAGLRAETVPAEPAAAEPTGEHAGVTGLRTRRRRAGRLLVAAAAAVVVGVGVGVVHDHIGAAGGSGSTTSASAGRSPLSSAGGGASGDSAGGGGAAGGAHLPAYLPEALGKPVRLVPSRFAEQVRTLRSERAPHALSGQTDASQAAPSPGGTPTNGLGSRPEPGSPAGSACVPGGVKGAGLVPVRYGRSPGVLAFRAPSGDSQVVDLYLCGQRRPVRSVTLPVR